MAGFYGVQFEALMKEVCVDFGRRLIRGWDEGADKEEVRKYVMEAAEEFFKRADGLKPKATVTIEKVEKKPRVSKKKEEDTENEAEITSDDVTEIKSPKKKSRATKKTEEVAKSKPKKAPAKKKESGKPKCEGVTAKGTQCSKCALDGEVFCSIHLKKAGKEEKEKPKGKGGKGITKGGKKKEDAPVHTHEVGEKPEECEVCEKYGDVFEVPEYEKDEDQDQDEDQMNPLTYDDDEKGDPNWALEEEDFDEDDDEEEAE